jgi:hypothetical protein
MYRGVTGQSPVPKKDFKKLLRILILMCYNPTDRFASLAMTGFWHIFTKTSA